MTLFILGISSTSAAKCRRAIQPIPGNPSVPSNPGTNPSTPAPVGYGPFGMPGGLNMYGLGYNAKHADGSCPTQQKVIDDFNILKKNVGSIRTFGLNDCNQGDFLVEASKQTGLKINLGLFVNFNDAEFDSEFDHLKRLLNSHKNTFINNVPSIIVGSETLYRKERTFDQLAVQIRAVKKYIQEDLKLNIKVTTADTKDQWYPHAVLDAVDYMLVNAYPYWESVSVEGAVDHLFNVINKVKQDTSKAQKMFVLGETGWPSGGAIMGASIPSKENQFTYFKNFYCRAKREELPYYYFAAFDEFWNANETKSAWGIMKTDGSTKDNYKLHFNC